MQISINQSERVYVIKNSVGLITIAFENVRDTIVQLCELMGLHRPIADLGTLPMYQAYSELLIRFKNHPANKKTWIPIGTAPKVKAILKKAIEDKGSTVLRIFYGNTITGYDWCEENNVTGFVGRSTGEFKVPLLLEAVYTPGVGLKSEKFGDVINCSSILRIINVVSGCEIYRHPKYQMPEFKIEPASPALKRQGYSCSVSRINPASTVLDNVANFKFLNHANEYIAFMQGHKVAMPFREEGEFQEPLAA